MDSTTPSSPLSASNTTTSTIQNEYHNEYNESSPSSNLYPDNTDPWAFLEKELDEFKRIVAELEQIKLEDSQTGN